LVPEAIYIANLHDLASYRQCVRAILYWRARGAVMVITRTGTPVVQRHLMRLGFKFYLREESPPVKFRYAAGPDALKAWLPNL
jgi:hypothetical protein